MQKNIKLKKGLRSGFTMIELIFVVIIIAVIAGVTVPKIMSNSSKTEISGVLGSDTESIYQAMNEWRSSASVSDGTFSNITTAGLGSYLPNNMSLVDPDGTSGNGDEYITSSGFNGNIRYYIISDTSATAGDSIKLFVDMSRAKNAQNWGNSLTQYAENKLIGLMVKYSSNPSISGDVGNINTGVAATAIGGANSAMTAGGTTYDGLVGLRRIAA